MNKKFTIIFVLTFFVIGMVMLSSAILKSNDDKFTGLHNHIDINNKDERIVFSYYKKGVASIFTSKLDGTDIMNLTNTNEESHLGAVYSSDGSQIIFISSSENKKNLKSSIWVMNKDGSNLKKIFEDVGLITEVTCSPNDKKVFFLKAGTYKNYSPIARKNPHEYDIYSINMDGKNLNQLTFDKNYWMQDLKVTADGSELFFIKSIEVGDMDYADVIHVLHLDESNSQTKIEPIGKKRALLNKSVYDLTISPDGENIIFSTVANEGTKERPYYQYELYSMNIETKKSEQLTHFKSNVGKPVYFHKSNKILFFHNLNWPENPSKYELYKINTDGTGKNKINIIIPEK